MGLPKYHCPCLEMLTYPQTSNCCLLKTGFDEFYLTGVIRGDSQETKYLSLGGWGPCTCDAVAAYEVKF